MWAGVRPGLQILWVCFWWTGRFDSDSLPPASFLILTGRPPARSVSVLFCGADVGLRKSEWLDSNLCPGAENRNPSKPPKR